jgi:hypothetical protein
MEEEDLSFPNPFFLQSANNPNPKQQKQPKPQISKCNCASSSSITQDFFSFTPFASGLGIGCEVLAHCPKPTIF